MPVIERACETRINLSLCAMPSPPPPPFRDYYYYNGGAQPPTTGPLCFHTSRPTSASYSHVRWRRRGGSHEKPEISSGIFLLPPLPAEDKHDQQCPPLRPFLKQRDVQNFFDLGGYVSSYKCTHNGEDGCMYCYIGGGRGRRSRLVTSYF